MSFDIFVQPCRFDGTTEKRINPFTKQSIDVPRNEPLSAEEIARVRAALERAGAVGPDDDGLYKARFDDGGAVDIFAGTIGAGLMFAVRGPGITPALAQLLYDVIVAGSWVVVDDDGLAVAPSPDAIRGAKNPFERVEIAKSADDLGALLSGGIKEWNKYKAQLARPNR